MQPNRMREEEISRVYRFADVPVGIETAFEEVHARCAAYADPGPAAFTVPVGRTEVEAERGRAEIPDCSDAYLASLAACRGVAERLPLWDAFLFHGSAVSVDGAAYVFAAPIGTGKSTHARLWRELLGGHAPMVNDDKPFLRAAAEGTLACGSPWDGKHRLSRNLAVPLRAVCLLTRAERNTIRPLGWAEALPALLRQTYRPADPAALERTLALLERLRRDTRFYSLGCNMALSAAELSYRTMSEG